MSESYDALERMRAHTGGALGTPTVVIDGEARIGFQPEWMAEKLAGGDN